jgi:hypothetical protein
MHCRLFLDSISVTRAPILGIGEIQLRMFVQRLKPLRKQLEPLVRPGLRWFLLMWLWLACIRRTTKTDAASHEFVC